MWNEQKVPPDASSETFRVLGLMAKHWTDGRVKTRLGATIGMQNAAQLHRLFVRQLTRSLQSEGQVRQVVGTPAEKLAEMRHDITSPWDIVAQSEGDLGRRMAQWFRSIWAIDRPRRRTEAVLIGADCPLLRPEEMAHAWLALQSHDVVLGPASDGGYYLIGVAATRWTSEHDRLFESIPWSSTDVLALTLAVAQEAELSVAQLVVDDDVDTFHDLRLLRSRMKSPDADGAWSGLAEHVEKLIGEFS